MPARELYTMDMIRGELSEVALVELLGNAYARGFTGKLDLVYGPARKQIYFLNGLPIYVSSDCGPSLIEVARQVKGLSAEDSMQLVTMQKEKGLSEDEVLKILEIFDDAGLYALHIEHFMQLILEACGWTEGRFRFVSGEDVISDVALFDLNPLEMIYQGIKTYHSLDLGTRLEEVQSKKARLNHGWEQSLALPQNYFQHSHLLDMFENEIKISEAIARLYQELNDINEAMLFIYMLLVTGLLELGEEEAPQVGPLYDEDEIILEEEVPKAQEKTAPAGPSPEIKETAQDAAGPPLQEGPSPTDEENREEEEARLLREIWARYIDISQRLDNSSDYFEWMNIDPDGDFESIRSAFAALRDELSLADVPRSVASELAPYQRNLAKEMKQAFEKLTDPDKRYEYEQALYNKLARECIDKADKEELAKKQWKRGMWYISSSNRPDLAQKCFQQAMELDQQNPEYPAHIGWAIYLNSKNERDRKEADYYLDYALNINPKYDQTHYFMGVIQKRNGKQEKALEHFRQALVVNPDNAQADREFHLIKSQVKQTGVLKRLLGKG